MTMLVRFVISIIWGSVLVTAGPVQDAKMPNKSGGNPSDVSTNAKDGKEFVLSLNAEQRAAFCKKAVTISIGDTREKVIALLGKPWSDKPLLKKEKPVFIARLVRYYVSKWRRDLVNERLDESVLFVFGDDDRLKKIVSTVPEIPSREKETRGQAERSRLFETRRQSGKRDST